jgi:hypothetical protein
VGGKLRKMLEREDEVNENKGKMGIMAEWVERKK